MLLLPKTILALIHSKKSNQLHIKKSKKLINEIPEQELRLHDLANKELVESIKTSLKKEATVDCDSIKHQFE